MRSQAVFGVVLVLAGLVILYLLKGVFYDLVVLVLGFIGVVIGLALVLGGLAMIFWSGRRWS